MYTGFIELIFQPLNQANQSSRSRLDVHFQQRCKRPLSIESLNLRRETDTDKILTTGFMRK